MTDRKNKKRFSSLLGAVFTVSLALILCFALQTTALAAENISHMATDILPPVIGSLNFNATSPTEKESFTVRARSVMDDLSGIKEVKFRVYRKGEASATKKTYAGTSDSMGNWSMVFRFTDFGRVPGEYIITVYAYDNAGNSSSLTKNIVVSGNPDKTAPVIESLNISESSPTSKANFTIRARNVTDSESGVAGVKFRVWRVGEASATKKNYTGKPDGQGNWSMTFKLENFGLVAGDYSITAYATDNTGNTSTVSKTISVNADTDPPTMSGIEFVGQPDITANTEFQIRAANVQDPSGVREVKFTIWRNGAASSTKKLVTGVSTGGGNYETPFTIADYGNKTGVYRVTVSAEDQRGNFAVLGTSQIEIVEPGHFAPPSMEGVHFSVNSPTTSKTFTIRAAGVYSEAGLKKVTFRVWREGAAGAAVSFTGKDAGGGSYTMAFDLARFDNKTGVYIVYVYGEDVFGNKGLMGMGSIEIASAKQEIDAQEQPDGIDMIVPDMDVVEAEDPAPAAPPEEAGEVVEEPETDILQ